MQVQTWGVPYDDYCLLALSFLSVPPHTRKLSWVTKNWSLPRTAPIPTLHWCGKTSPSMLSIPAKAPEGPHATKAQWTHHRCLPTWRGPPEGHRCPWATRCPRFWLLLEQSAAPVTASVDYLYHSTWCSLWNDIGCFFPPGNFVSQLCIATSWLVPSGTIYSGRSRLKASVLCIQAILCFYNISWKWRH